ncbi:MAG: bifunctional phosphoribosyl-AMP cyclohydrolase/phosphoribosyl-ATP diphosphatase HisIE [Xanthomonadales bacterium]|nr:bifunctional phosphoribosyl-AMP cyclohydrolase/phosphoribosyl-ATP diphosphatase HisIE [Gammaproteobacteria bacterium]MBT8051810.1 bifunctional phosphoribosyl-AMP cyclohydrolase/phosphoribosyl-ATP diphosphatase HisIE [Gammaproteobacteria bacterium]MBT8057795.1 bifunctional phosphoribosyl-AMP cyclohydrolase/phosphoribosyl-ATP diphosphatase HisIE [Gammaproteobacteria bacterium]NNJ77804.1 bifunctional phosphoribosyl-AMP cyclohydrolase/phosphoribosyl-ATP diphosphatase HisIE [Xanthomonadales bacter
MLIRDSRQINAVDWDKMSGLVPAVVQDSFDGRVLMLGYMNREALSMTLDTGRVTFWSRSRDELWTKGATSGHALDMVAIHADCDNDALLVMAHPSGPTCHQGTDTCFDGLEERTAPGISFLAELERVVAQRYEDRPEGSYTTTLFDAGVKRIAQKVGEEGVETALAAVAGDYTELENEAADLLFHLLVLLRDCGLTLSDVTGTLESRHG